MVSHPGFFVFEGLDGSGKSTLSRYVFDRLSQQSVPAICFAEPTKYETGQFLRKFLRGEIELSGEDQIQAFLKDREMSLEKNILPALAEGKIVLLDRYIYSTAAYQSGLELSAQEILRRNLEQGFPEPDLLFYLDLDPELALLRMEGRENAKERFESLEVLRKIRDSYESILPSSTIRLDAKKTTAELANIVLEKILSVSGDCR
ncbi:dTMP kinase [Leptospira fainei serovar Hurstbridge str. BUT 6]|uniref:Thymidylate kinase n=1 Tax=Leptospira fainei serovar Hurstbridge str. BUT 6 TaxID=1193011 RepID=S3VDA9_9LEPT|nr:dTMP kinase [Leptospira fainei]EPG74470.1 dTMP kinase [Leptospira fainei serovar Hurstbridge str. BUT 6]